MNFSRRLLQPARLLVSANRPLRCPTSVLPALCAQTVRASARQSTFAFQGATRPLTTTSAHNPRWKRFCRWFVIYPYSLLALVPTGTALAWLHARVVEPENVARRRHWSFFTWTGVVAFLWGPTVPGFAPLVWAFDWDHRRYYDWLLRHWARTTTSPYFQPVIEGAEKLPPLWAGGNHRQGLERDAILAEGGGKGVVFVCNHQSWMDIYTLAWLPIELKFVCKREIAYIPLCGW